MSRFMCLFLFIVVTAIHASEAEFTAFPVNGKNIVVLKDGNEYLTLGFGGWGINWSWMGFGKSRVSEKDDATVLSTSDKIRSNKTKVDFQSLVIRKNKHCFQGQVAGRQANSYRCLSSSCPSGFAG